jgi:predicted GNAT family N-acyltransferase
MLTVRIADFAADEPALRSVRFAVFVDEQRVPADVEIDDRDPLCVHVLALDGDVPVGTGRVDIEIGRVAVVPGMRRRGVGTLVMERLHAIAAELGLARVWCHAQTAALPFYEGLGYRATGSIFDEADIPHVRMERPLGVSGSSSKARS